MKYVSSSCQFLVTVYTRLCEKVNTYENLQFIRNSFQLAVNPSNFNALISGYWVPMSVPLCLLLKAAHLLNMVSTVLECAPVRTVLPARQLMERVLVLLDTAVQTAANVSVG